MKKILFLLTLTAFIVSCSNIIPFFKQGKIASKTRSELALSASDYFWVHFHEGHYEKIPKILNRLKEAYIENPNDAMNVAHIGFTHAWAASERIRLKELRPDIIDHYALAARYFKEAYELDPNDVRLLGFHGDFLMADATLAKNDKKIIEGYFKVKKAIDEWPEWGNFTLSYFLSLSPADSDLFQESIDLMWGNLDVCALENVDRKNPDYTKYYALLKTELTQKNRRACWNTWIAPHNLEGFFIHFGDILVKSGDWQAAIKMYNNAKTSQEYENYPYKEALNKRIKNAKANITAFNNYPQKMPVDSDKVLMIDSQLSCMGCHQKKRYIPVVKATDYVAPHLK